jgi:hypothetical protein
VISHNKEKFHCAVCCASLKSADSTCKLCGYTEAIKESPVQFTDYDQMTEDELRLEAAKLPHGQQLAFF